MGTINEKYYIGIDVGTDSCGWAVTDEEYNIKKFKGNAMWGVRLFDESQTAENRRAFRTSRRRLDRRGERLAWLESVFADEIGKIDPEFFLRLKESQLHFEDKITRNKYSLFSGDYIVDRVEKDYSSLTKLSREKRLGMDTDDYPMEREKIVKECFGFVKEKIEGKNGKREGSDRKAIIYRLLYRLDKSCEKDSKDKIKGESLLFAAICLACEDTFFGMLKSTGEPVKTLRKANAGELATDYIYAYPFVRV